MIHLAAFADEISPDLDEQIAGCTKCGIKYVELRSVAERNVLDFDRSMREEIKKKFTGHGLGVASIGSVIGKVKLSDSFEAHFERFKIAVELAEFFDAPLIRIFSYYGAFPGGRDEVLRRMEKKVEYVQRFRPVLVHENDVRTYGEKAAQCLELHQTINSPKFRAAFDFANFLQTGENPLSNWRLLKPYTAHFHIKDVIKSSGKIVPAGQGDGHVAEVLEDAYANGYSGFLSLEPHLSIAGQFSGFTGLDLFGVAVEALRDLAKKSGIPLAA
jgi:3-dehydroshikimate dehydratase